MKSPVEHIVDFFREVIPPDVVATDNIYPAFTKTDKTWPALTVSVYGAHTSDTFYGMIKKIVTVGRETMIYYAYDKRITLRVTCWSDISRHQADEIAQYVEDALHRDWNNDHTINYCVPRLANHIFNCVEILYDNVEPDDEIRQWSTVLDFFLVMENEWIETLPSIEEMDLEILGELVKAEPARARYYMLAPVATTHDVLTSIQNVGSEAEAADATVIIEEGD